MKKEEIIESIEKIKDIVINIYKKLSILCDL